MVGLCFARAFDVNNAILPSFSCALFIPVDVVKERLQVQSTRNMGYSYSGSFNAFRTILKEEGARGLYKGYFATLFSYGPFSAIYFGVYEEVRICYMNLCDMAVFNILLVYLQQIKRFTRNNSSNKDSTELNFSQNLIW
jgi:hypothetical protein